MTFHRANVVKKLPNKKSKGEESMALLLSRLGIRYVRQYKFHRKRKWLADFALPDYSVLIEVQGGVGGQQGHDSYKGYTKDCERMNAAALCGWRMLYFTTWMVGAKAEDTLRELIRREERMDAGEAYDEEETRQAQEQADRRRPGSRRAPLRQGQAQEDCC